jgi:hypothetical protein
MPEYKSPTAKQIATHLAQVAGADTEPLYVLMEGVYHPIQGVIVEYEPTVISLLTDYPPKETP